MKNPLLRIRVAVALIVLAACESGLASTDAPVVEIRIAPQPAMVELESTLQLDARLTDASGNALNGRTLFWASEDQTIARVSASGEVTGVAPGTTRVAASADGMSGIGTVTVVPKAVARVTLSPSSLDLVVGESAPLTAVPLDRDDRPLVGRPVSWGSSDPTVAAVDENGQVAALAEGSTRVRATVEGIDGEATVSVSRKPVVTVDVSPQAPELVVGETMQLTATARAADGSPLEGRSVSWSSSNPGVVSVGAEGLANAIGVGAAVVTALIEGKSGDATVTVIVKQVATVEISPPDAQMTVGATQLFTATAKGSDGAALTGRTSTWSIADAAIARVDANGLVTALAPGQTSLTASIEGKSATARVIVNQVPVSTVEVSPTSAQLFVGGSRQFSAVAKDAGGNPLGGRVVSWSTDLTSVATVSDSGMVTAVAPGVATVTAVIEGKSASAPIHVSPPPVAAVEVTPSSASVRVGATQQLTATLRDADGNVLSARTVTWSSSAPSVASVSSSGLVTGKAGGQATVTATSEGESDGSAITVVTAPAPVATVHVSPPSAQLKVGSTGQFTATLEAADGTVLTGRSISWSTGNANVATVNGSGLVTANAAGQTSITATSEGKSGSAALTVVNVPVATVTVTPESVNMKTGETRQLSVTLRAEDGTLLTGRTVTWSSSNGLVASVGSTGLVTALLPGEATITATSEGKSGGSRVTVTLESVEVAEASARAALSAARTLASARDAATREDP
jgi:uncharacterized protein YjdB